jgi:hypothetical protein
MKVLLINKLNPTHTKYVNPLNVGIHLSGTIMSNFSIIIYQDDQHPILLEPHTVSKDVIEIQQYINNVIGVANVSLNKVDEILHFDLDLDEHNPLENLFMTTSN